MKAGFNLLLWTSHVTEQHFPLLQKLKKAGYDGVEIPILEGTPSHYAKVLKAVRDNGLACAGAGHPETINGSRGREEIVGSNAPVMTAGSPRRGNRAALFDSLT
jgi:sugar phosphate isomerase/epimerase